METVHVVAINPYRKGNKGKVFSYNIDTYDKVIGSKEIKKMIQQIRGELPIDGVNLNDAQAVKKAQERLKSELPFFCPHYGMFKNNVRRQENALPESFLFQTIIDVDDKEYVEKAIEKARELNCSSGIWNGSLLHLCYSARKKLHIGIRMPVGMTIEETQKAYCEALGVPYDESCITPERMIFLTDKDSEIYRSKMWCAVLPESEIQARRKAFLDRGLTVDGRGDAKVNSLQFTVNGNSNDNVQNNRLSGNHGTGELGEASEKNLIAFDLFVQSAGLEGMAIDTVGSRHSSLLAIMSAGASRVMSEEELMKVVRTKMPSYYQEDDCHQLIHDFYAKYADSSKPMSRDVIRVNALAEQKANEVKSEERRVKNSSAPSTSSAAYADQADAVEVKAGGRTYRFAKKDGRLMGVEVGSKAISLSNGPRFMAARRSDRSLDQFYNHDDKEAEKKKTLYTEFVDQGAFAGFEWKEAEAKLVATYQHGSLDEVDWQFLSDGSVAVTCHYNFGGVVDMMGMAFDYPESKVRSKAWVGNGPYRVWQNREQGPQYGYWQNDYNDPIPAESWDYPEFKGYFANVKWMQFKTDEGKIGFSGLTADEHMGVYTPRDGRDGLLYTLPQTGLAVFKVIPSVRNKVNTTDLNGPSAQPKWLNGKGKTVFTLNFEL